MWKNLSRELKKLWNMKVTFIPIVIGAHGTVTEGLVMWLEDLKIRGGVDTIQTTTLLRSIRILRRDPWDMRRLHHHHHIVLVARISLTLSRHSSLSFIALGRSSGQHPVCCPEETYCHSNSSEIPSAKIDVKNSQGVIINNNNNKNNNHLIPARRPGFITINKKKRESEKLSTFLSRRTTE